MKLAGRAHGMQENFKKVVKIYADHYVVFSSTIFIVFTALCYLYTTGYYSNFGIDFYHVGSLSDVYQAALTGQILLFLYFLLVITFSISLVISRESQELADNPSRSQMLLLFTLLVGIATIVMLPILYYVTSTKEEVLKIKEGFAARYTIHTESGQIDCLPIVASTGDYIVVWDGQLEEARIISRQGVGRIDLVIEPPPEKYLWLLRGRPTQVQLDALVEKQQRWSEKLKTKCGLTVDWPQHKPIES